MSLEAFGRFFRRSRAGAEAEQIRLDDLEIDLAERTVRRGGETLPVSGLNFDVLAVLVEAAPGLADARLLASAWPVRHVSEATIAKRVALLRGALGETAQRSAYIETVRGRGYRIKPRLQQAAGARLAVPLRPAIIGAALAASLVLTAAFALAGPSSGAPAVRTLISGETGAVLTLCGRMDPAAAARPVILNESNGDIALTTPLSAFPDEALAQMERLSAGAAAQRQDGRAAIYRSALASIAAEAPPDCSA